MPRFLAVLLLALVFSGCGKDPMVGVPELMKAASFDAALAELQARSAKKPELPVYHYTLFVLNRYLALQGDAGKSESRLGAAISEYRWIADKEGIVQDFTDMEKSLKSTDKARAAYEAAYALVYSR